MKIRELESVERDACRQKAATKVILLTREFKGLSGGEAFDKAHKFFECARDATIACNENFQQAKFIARENYKKPWEVLKLIMMGGQQGIYLMENTCNVMEGDALSRVNGTSILFNDCVKTMNTLKKDYGDNIAGAIQYMKDRQLELV